MERAALAKAWIQADALSAILNANGLNADGLNADGLNADGAETEREPCGVLLGSLEGTAARIQKAPQAPNTHPTPQRAFRIAPQDLLAIVRAARQEGLTVVGFWHGHLVGPPELGRADEEGLGAAEALGPSARLMVVTGKGTGRARVVRAYTRGRYGLREVPLGT